MAKRSPTIQQIDRKVTKLAKAATSAAYRRALASGHSVLIAKNGEIRRVSPDGRSVLVKKTAPDIPVEKGSVIFIK